jgi:hypothetical protein
MRFHNQTRRSTPTTPRHHPIQNTKTQRLVQGLRPWVSTPCSLLLCSLADRFRAHRFVLLFCFAASTLLRGALALAPPSFGAIAGLILVSDALAAPVPVIADASVVAKCVRDGDYGKQR